MKKLFYLIILLIQFISFNCLAEVPEQSEASKSVVRTWLAVEIKEDLGGVKDIIDATGYKFLDDSENPLTIFTYNEKYYILLGHGSSYKISQQNHFVTNSHVVSFTEEDKALMENQGLGENIKPTVFIVESLKPFKIHKGKEIWKDKQKDLALLQYKTANPEIPVLKFSNNQIQKSLPINSIGFPSSSDSLSGGIKTPENYINPSNSEGILRRSVIEPDTGVKQWEHSSAISPGSSGGPVVNKCGEIVATNVKGIPGEEGAYAAIDLEMLIPALKQNNIPFEQATSSCDPDSATSVKTIYIVLGILVLLVFILILYLFLKKENKKEELPPETPPIKSKVYWDQIESDWTHIKDNHYVDPYGNHHYVQEREQLDKEQNNDFIELKPQRNSPVLRIYKNKPVTVGRGSQNDIVVNNEKVSKRHFVISYDGNNLYIEDLNSTNGTIVNGRKIYSKEVLKFGSSIILTDHAICEWHYGDHEIQYNGHTELIKPFAKLKAMNNNLQDINLHKNGKEISIGKSKENVDIHVNNKFVSRIHCFVVVDNRGVVTLIDNNSLNGTFHNSLNTKVNRATLNNGDIIYLGSGEVSYQFNICY